MLSEIHDLRFFQDLNTRQLERLTQDAYIMECAAGDVILDQDTEERFIGYMVEGVAKVTLERSDGSSMELETNRNAPVGSMLLDGFNVAAPMTALEPVRIIAWPLESLKTLEAEQPSLAMLFYKGVNFYLIQYMRRLIGTL